MMRSDVAVTTKGLMEVSRQVHVVSLVGAEPLTTEIKQWKALKLPRRTNLNRSAYLLHVLSIPSRVN